MRPASVIIAAGLALALAGCAGGTSPGAAPTGTAAPGFDEATKELQRPSDDTGGRLRVLIERPCATTPTAIADPACADVARTTTRQLMAYASLPGRFGSVVVPDLVREPGSTPDGGRTWTYELRADARWSDGSLITAEDARSGLLALDAALPEVDIARVDADGQRLTIALRAAAPALDQLLALPVAAPRRGALASGPFIASESGTGSPGLLLVRNGAWSPASDPIRRPLADEIELIVTTPSRALPAIRAGEAEVSLIAEVPAAQGEALLADPGLAPSVDHPGTGAVVFLQVTGAGWSTRCRQGLFSALDRTAVVQALGGPSTARIATTMSAPTIASYEPSYRPFGIGDGSGDLAAARTALAGCPTSLSLGHDGALAGVADAIGVALARAGVSVTPVSAGTPAPVPADAPLDAVLRSWTAPVPGVWGFWAPLAQGLDMRAVDTLLASPEIGSTDPDVQADVGRVIDRLVLDDARLIPLAFRVRPQLRPPALTNVATSGGFANLYDLVNLGIAPSAAP